MPRIRLLDQGTVNKIAAGEVVERPASVVKEMTENAIDAGADKITVEIKGGGIQLIRITDNGCGIAPEDVRTAFLRHSTSKIRKVEDLLKTTSLGFRGEALASIAAVARVEMLTKTKDALTGIRFVIEGGEEKVFEEVACPSGTTILVENLFFNTPPRKKFLKKESAEAAAVTDLMQKLTLAHPEISFRYLNGKREPSIYSSGNGNLKNSIYAVFGKDIVDKLIPVEGQVALESKVGEESAIHVRGYLSRPQLTKTNRSLEIFFINGRYIHSALLEKAVDEAFKDYIVPGTFPAAILHLTMDPSSLDVNVHPTKMEIRFNDEEAVRRGVYEVLAGALKGENLIARIGDFYKTPLPEEEPKEELRMPFLPKTPPKGARVTTDYKTRWRSDIPEEDKNKIPKGYSFAPISKAFIVEEDNQAPKYDSQAPKSDPKAPKNGEGQEKEAAEGKEPKTAGAIGGFANKGEQIRVHEDNTLPPPVVITEKTVTDTAAKTLPHELRLIGQIFRTYWIAEEKNVFYIVDQHAAHERVLYDRYRKLLSEGKVDTQVLMEPQVVSVQPKALAELPRFQPILQKMGYEVEAFGDDAVIVRGVPFLFNKALPAEDTARMIDMLYDGQIDTARDLLIDKIAMMSCKAAVKGNDAMSFMEAESLLKQLFASSNPYNCPHGRPTVISVTEYQLEKRFKRV